MPAGHRVLRNCLLATSLAMASGMAMCQETIAAQNPSRERSNLDERKCTLSGQVVSTVGGAPVRKATVHLISATARMNESAQSTTTDAAGRFRFSELAAGQYKLMVSHPSFISSAEPARSSRLTMTYTLSPGQEVKDVLVRLTPAAVLRGRVIDEDGDPVPRAEVEVLRASKSGSAGQSARIRAMQLRAGGSVSDDQGEFRIFGLAPGRYYLRANPSMEGNVRGPARKADAPIYIPTFYPAASSRETATAVELRGGDELSVNIALARANVYPVLGIVRTAKGDPVAAGMVMASQAASVISNVQVREGKFELWLPAGHYSLRLIGIPDEGLSGNERPPSVYRAIDVPEGGLRDVELVLSASKAAAQITGRIRAEAGALPEGRQLFVVLQPMNPPNSDEDEEDDAFGDRGSGGYATVKPDGTFAMKDVAGGTYELVIGTQGTGLEDWYTKSVFVGTRDELNSGIIVSGAALQLDVVVSPKGGTAEGLVKNGEQQPAPNATVVLVPDAARARRHSLYETTSADQNGHFSMRGLEPGQYTVYAWDNAEGQPWFDADVMKRYKDDGVPITIRASEKTHAEVHVQASPLDEDTH